MIFLQPMALWGLLGLLVPVVIHLFNFQKTERIIFANTRLLTEVVQKTQKARQLKNWLLLLLRILALTAIVLAFAQPRLKSATTAMMQQGLPQVAVFLDNSSSMMVAKEEAKPFDLAWNLARSTPGNFQNKGWFQLITNQFEAKHQWTSANGFRDQVTEVLPVSKGRKLNTVLERGIRQMKDQRLGDHQSLFLLSDFQKSTTGPLEELSLDSQAHYHFAVMAHEPISNVYVDSVWLPKMIQVQEKSQILKIRLAQAGVPFDKPLNVKLLANGNLISGKTVNLNDLPVFDLELPFRIKAGERLNAEIQLDDAPVSFDNHFYFVLQAPPPVNVVLIDESASPFIRLAFQHPLFRFKTTNPKNADIEIVKSADCIIINEITNLDNALSQAIESRCKEGASAMFIPGKGSKLPNWFPIKTELIAESPGGKATDWKIKFPGKENRFYAGTIAEIKANPSLPFSKPGTQIFGGIPVLSYENGETYLAMEKMGLGQVFVCAGAFSEGISNVQKHPIFIPTLFKIAFSGNRSAEVPLFYRTQSGKVVLASDSISSSAEKPILLKNDNKEIRVVPQQMGKSIQFDLPGEMLNPGIWNIVKGNQMLESVAINAPSEESQMNFYTASELKSAFEGKSWITVTEVSSNVSPETVASTSFDEFPLWKICLLIGLLFLIGEMVLARFNQSPNPAK